MGKEKRHGEKWNEKRGKERVKEKDGMTAKKNGEKGIENDTRNKTYR